MDSALIAWDARPREIAADPAATLSLDRDRWQASGAYFESYDDEIGGVTAVATASTRSRGEGVPFGVLDYGESTSYLIVAGSYEANADLVDIVIQALIADGTITADDVLERLPSDGDPGSEPTGDPGDPLRRIGSGSQSADPGRVHQLGVERPAVGTLHGRDLEIMSLIEDGRSNEEIARQLLISPKEVSDRLRRSRTGLRPHEGSEVGFISYAHRDTLVVQRFLELMRPRCAVMRELEIDAWWDPRQIHTGEHWEDELAVAIDACDFGLLCITPHFLASTYVTQARLPALLDRGVVIPVAMQAVDLDRVDGLQDHQVFRYRPSGASGQRAFGQCAGVNASRFCDALVAQMVGRLAATAPG